jgi:hypothetical protein
VVTREISYQIKICNSKCECTLTRDVSHCGLAIYIKTYLKAKEESGMETQIFHNVKI